MTLVVISYIPALHQGYINFFKEYPGSLLVLGKNFVLEHPRMERDIRAVDPEQIVRMIASLNLMHDVRELKDVSHLNNEYEIIMPDEDVNRFFAEKYLKMYKVQFVPVFLRWDRHISTTEFEIPPDRTISKKDLDRELLLLAKNEAKKSADWWRQIGAVIAKNEKPLLIGHNRPLLAENYTVNIFGDPRSNFDAGEYIELVKTIHAEAGIIAEAAKRGIALEDASMYVTTFPCPVCAKLIAASGIKKVFYEKGYSLLDAEDILKSQGIEIVLVK